MKIFFIPYLNIASAKLPKDVLHKEYVNENRNQSLSDFYYLPLNFKSNRVSDELKKVENVNCPVCGVKMLSEEQYSKIVEESKNIDKPQDFYNFLLQYKGHIPLFYLKIIKHTQASLESSTIDAMKDLFATLSKVSKSRLKTYLKRAAEDLEYSKKYGEFSDDDKKKLDICIQELRKPSKEKNGQFQKFSYYINLMRENLQTMENLRKDDIYLAVREKLKDAFLYSGLFVKNWSDSSSLNMENDTMRIVARLFAPSVKKTGLLSSSLNNIAGCDINTILLCEGCDKNSNSTISIINKNSNAPIYMENYFESLAKSIADGKVDLPGWYPISQAKKIVKLAKIDIDIDNIKEILKTKIFEDFHSSFDFKVLDFENVPCACCGIKTLTHEQKLNALKKIQQAANANEIFHIADEYESSIRPEYKEILDEYRYMYEKFPNFSENDIIDILRKKMCTEVDVLLLETLDAVKNKANTIDLSANDKKLLSQYINKIKANYVNKEFEMWFPYKMYNEVVNQTLLKMESEKKFELIEIAKGDIRDKHVLQSILYVHPNILQKMSPLKGMLQNMLKASVITADHIIPRDKNGGNELYNMAAFCKFCNQKKTDMHLKYFYNFQPQMAQNMQKYLNKVVRLIKSGELVGYESYPAQFAAQIRRLTRYNKKPIILRFSPIEKKD